MTASPERRIDIVAVRFESQRSERLAGKHRNVLSHDRYGRERPPAVLYSWAVPSSQPSHLPAGTPRHPAPSPLLLRRP